MKELLTTADFAREVGRTPAAIRAAARDGRISVDVTTVSGQRLFTRAEAARFKATLPAKKSDRSRAA